MSARAWRLLLDGAAAAARNMAIDEALLLHARRPVLRLYAWDGPCISVGYRQSSVPWLERAGARGVDVVRRISGGGDRYTRKVGLVRCPLFQGDINEV